MPLGPVEPQAVRKHVEEILRSPGFERNDRLSRFLRFIVEQHLEGRGAGLKESVIGTEVFGRAADYNPKSDPIVRTEARRLRARLGEFYERTGGGATLVIELPKGGYVPLVRAASAAEGTASAPTGWAAKLQRSWFVAPALAAVVLLGVALLWAQFAPVHRSRPHANSPAYDTFLRAREAEMAPACTGAELSAELFEQAIAKDSSFAPAYAGLAAMEAARSGFDRFNPIERAAMIAKGWTAARKAIQLDSLLPDAQDALGMMQARQAQWQLSQSSFRRAIAIAPGEPLWRDHFAVFMLLPLGKIKEAIRQLRKAEELAPKQLETHYALTVALRSARRFDDADFHCRNAADNERQLSGCWAEILIRQGKNDDAVRILETAWTGHLLNVGAESLGIAYARAGRRQDAERIATLVPRLSSKAVIFAALGDKDRAFEILDRMLPMGPTRMGRDLISPEFAVLRGDARLDAIRRKLALPETMPPPPE